MRKLMWIFAVAALAVLSTNCKQTAIAGSSQQGRADVHCCAISRGGGAFQDRRGVGPRFAAARLYLATAYMQQYIPGSIFRERENGLGGI